MGCTPHTGRGVRMREAWSFGDISAAAGDDRHPRGPRPSPGGGRAHRARRSTRGVARRTPSPTASPAPVGCPIVVHRSRFEVDLNRARHQCVYEDAGRRVGPRGVARAAHRGAGRALAPSARRVLRHARRLPRRPRPPRARSSCSTSTRTTTAATVPIVRRRRPSENPEVNIGTGSLDRDRWGHVVDRFMGDLGAADGRGPCARRPRERPLRGRLPVPVGARALSGQRLRARRRAQEGLHGRVDRRARRSPPRRAHRRRSRPSVPLLLGELACGAA